jgi:CheY-like chemotaxis protein
MKVLVAEDDSTIRQMIGALLARRGVPCSLAEDGESAVDAWEGESFDMIFMDVQMPGMDGLEATRIIRQKEQERGGHVVIIAMTAHTMPEDKEECFQSGMDNYISKPIVFDELLALIEKHAAPKEAD